MTFTLSLFTTHYALSPFATLAVIAASRPEALRAARKMAHRERCGFWTLVS